MLPGFLFAFLSLFCIAFHATHAGACQLSDGGTQIACAGIQIDTDGRSFEERLRTAIANSSCGKVTKIVVVVEGLDLYIHENTLAGFFSLSKLEIRGDPLSFAAQILAIDQRAFRHTPALAELYLHKLAVTDDTVRAVASLKDQLGSLSLIRVWPEDEISVTQRVELRIVPQIASFTRLWNLSVNGACAGRGFVPSALLAKSAATLRQLSIVDCPAPSSKITKHTFGNLSSLANLEWVNSGIAEIEAHSFDSIPTLEQLRFYGNRIRSLPVGLFTPLIKLVRVNFANNPQLSGLVRENFSHVENFGTSFQLLL